MQNENELTSRQLAVIAHLLSSASIEEACRRAKVSKPTVYAWLKDDAFRNELQRQRDDIYKESLAVLKAGGKRAVEKLLKLVDSKKEEIALRACSQILTHALRLKELEIGDKHRAFDSPFSADTLREVWARRKGERENGNAEHSTSGVS